MLTLVPLLILGGALVQSRATQHEVWIRPADTPDAQPIYGIEHGIRVGLHPTDGGPRGLIRIYAPYLDNPPGQVINFIAVEPMIGGRRGYSELEPSATDRKPGKMMWTFDEFPTDPARIPDRPARGRIIKVDGVEALTFFIVVERFDSGASPIVQVILRPDRPHEVMLRTFTARGGAKMDACILSATMGNYARLRRLHLKDEVVEPKMLWPGFASRHPHGRGFTRHATWGVDQMIVTDGSAEVSATPDEPDPQKATYAPDTPEWWQYRGKPARQFWRARAAQDLKVRVNGRFVYWAGDRPIPGGVAFENFEMEAPFHPGGEFVFGVEPMTSGDQ
jgi:hypothetical protein